ncbi:hypothetical protein ACFY5D_03575 [Paeniglutamicibacter sp. NPDC012692]|uniref:hypothetical protein n=1 Tax=Paeniglutamicibacter sp. NPDC012692 TaxID=3364388 RepID=UPI0036765BAF
MITQQQASALAEVLAMIRPNDWKPRQLMTLFAKHREDHNFPALAEAAIRAARNPAIRSPETIFLPGKHWLQPGEEPDRLPPRQLWCPEHERPENECRRQHYRTEPPAGWRAIVGNPGTTSPTGNQHLQPKESVGDNLSAANEPGQTIPHPAPAKPGASE